MVREGRVIIRDANGDPDYGSNYYVTAYEVGAIVSAVYDGSGIPVDAGHGFAANDKFIVLSEFPAVTKYGTVTSVTSTKLFCATVSVAIGDVLINLAQDTGVSTPNYNGNGLAVYSDMDYGSQLTNNTTRTDANGRYRYFYNNLPIWELVRTATAVPFTAYLDTGLSGVGGTTSSTDNAVVRWDGATGQTLQNSSVIIADAVSGSSDVTGVRDLTVNNNLTVVADAAVGDDLTVTGTSTLADVTVSTTLAVTGAITAGAGVTVTGGVSTTTTVGVGSALTVATTASVGTDLSVTGLSTLSGHIRRGVSATITAAASPNNTQAGGTVLTKDINNISTCTTSGDAVVMPSAVAGMMITIFNNGASSCNIFPSSGDDFTGTPNVAVALGSGLNVTYACVDATHWENISKPS